MNIINQYVNYSDKFEIYYDQYFSILQRSEIFNDFGPAL